MQKVLCGCTVPQWPREEIAPGETGEIKVRYDTKRIGMINKTVTIQSNAMNADDITKNRKDAEGKTIGGTSMIKLKERLKDQQKMLLLLSLLQDQ